MPEMAVVAPAPVMVAGSAIAMLLAGALLRHAEPELFAARGLRLGGGWLAGYALVAALLVIGGAPACGARVSPPGAEARGPAAAAKAPAAGAPAGPVAAVGGAGAPAAAAAPGASGPAAAGGALAAGGGTGGAAASSGSGSAPAAAGGASGTTGASTRPGGTSAQGAAAGPAGASPAATATPASAAAANRPLATPTLGAGVVLDERSIAWGRQLVEQQNCRACHRVQGTGGSVGPDLSNVGGRRGADWIFRHFKDPQGVSPGTLMPRFLLGDDEFRALTAYVLTLKE